MRLSKATSAVVISAMLAGCAIGHRRVSTTTETATAPFSNAIEMVKRSVVPVVCVQTNPTGPWTLLSVEGTGFFISSGGAFLTPAHVLRAMASSQRRSPCPTQAIYMPRGGWRSEAPNLDIQFFSFDSRNCIINEGLDIAMCRSTVNIEATLGASITPLEIDIRISPDGTEVAFTGFPLSSVQPLTSRGTLAARRESAQNIGATELVIDKSAWPGASGSPVYLESGKVIGMVIQRGDGSGISIARTSNAIEYFLNQTNRQ